MIYQIVPLLFLTLISPTTYAKNIPGLITQNLSNGEQIWSFPIETLFFITSLTFIPAVLLMMTSFTRIIIVLGFLRSAIGTPYAPSNQILLGLSLFLTFFIMSPVFEKSYKESYVPYSENKISAVTAVQNGFQPFKKFMLKQVRKSDLELFCKLSHTSSNFPNKELIPIKILLPSFITSELKTAFQIGFTIFIPFLIIDLVVSSILMSLGMMMVPPSSISLPFKIMLFVLVDGWNLLISSLSNSFF